MSRCCLPACTEDIPGTVIQEGTNPVPIRGYCTPEHALLFQRLPEHVTSPRGLAILVHHNDLVTVQALAERDQDALAWFNEEYDRLYGDPVKRLARTAAKNNRQESSSHGR